MPGAHSAPGGADPSGSHSSSTPHTGVGEQPVAHRSPRGTAGHDVVRLGRELEPTPHVAGGQRSASSGESTSRREVGSKSPGSPCDSNEIAQIGSSDLGLVPLPDRPAAPGRHRGQQRNLPPEPLAATPRSTQGNRGWTVRPPRCSCPVEAFAAFVLVVERDVGAEQGGHLVPRAGAVASDTAAVVGATELPHELGERAAEPEGPGLRADGLGADAGEQEVLERGRLDAVIAGLLFMAGGCGGAR